MKKQILAVYFSQSGQLKSIADQFLLPFHESEHEIEWWEVKPEQSFTFPWNGKSFFDAMPESVLGIPVSLQQPSFKKEKYDLIIFAYQPWFLSPSIPATSALKHPEFQKRLRDTDVITLIGARNMWISAQEKVKALLVAAKARLAGNVVLTDRHQNLISAITIQYWMFTGKKERMWGIFPLPGISKEDIIGAREFGITTAYFLKNGDLSGMQAKIVEAGGVEVKENLMFVESRASLIFNLWANAINKKQNRDLWLRIFKYYLFFALFVIAPFVLIIYTIFISPFIQKSVRTKKNYYLGLS